MRKALAAVALLTACAVPRTAEAPKPKLGPVEHAVAHTVYLDDSGCSAVNVGGLRLVTAKHCAPDDAKAGDAYEGGTLVFVSPTEDFVVVAMIEAPYWIDRIELRQAELGEHLYVVGYPQQLFDMKQHLTVTDGIAAGPVDDERQARITAPVYFGNSGGGVWADDGSLIGIAVSIYAAPIEGLPRLPYAGQSFMVPIEHVRPYL